MAEHTVRLVNNSLTFQTYWQVGMSCEGCAKAVKGVMGKTEGVTSCETDVANKKVKVVGTADAATIETALKKTGKTVQRITEEN